MKPSALNGTKLYPDLIFFFFCFFLLKMHEGGSNEKSKSEKKNFYSCLRQNNHLLSNIVNMSRGANYRNISHQNNTLPFMLVSIFHSVKYLKFAEVLKNVLLVSW